MKNRKLEDVDDFNEEAVEILENFINTFTKDSGLIRDITEDDDSDCEQWAFIYTAKGIKLVERMIARLRKVGSKYFDEDDIEISTYLYQES